MKERREFLFELARLLSDRGWFDLMNLWVGDRVVGSNYGFRFQGSWFWYCPTIVNEFEDLSPGICLLAKVVEDACHDPEVHLVDLGLERKVIRNDLPMPSERRCTRRSIAALLIY